MNYLNNFNRLEYERMWLLLDDYDTRPSSGGGNEDIDQDDEPEDCPSDELAQLWSSKSELFSHAEVKP